MRRAKDRAALHRALDAVLDKVSTKAKDARNVLRLVDPRGGGQGRKVDAVLRGLGYKGGGGFYRHPDGGDVVFREGAMGRSTLTMSDMTSADMREIEFGIDKAGMLA